MQTKETLTCEKPVTQKLEALLSGCYELSVASEIIDNSYCMPSRNGQNIYYYRPRERIRLDLESYKSNIVSIGIQYALYRGRKPRLYPSLGLLTLIRIFNNQPLSHYVIIKPGTVMLFTYGRDILQDSIVELVYKEECKTQPLIVLSVEGEPLGYGLLRSVDGKVLVQNILDVGWYLRSGV